MKTRDKSIIILLLLFLIYSLPSSAQKMTVESMVPTNDQTANLSENMLKDNNGDYAGLVKVMLAAPNVDFEGLVLKKQVHTASEHWVFMAKGSTRLKVTVPGYLPLPIDFRDYGINGIEPLRTYVLTITLPQVGAIQQDDGMRYLAMTVEPKNSMVFVDDNLQTVDENGEVSVYLKQGRHTYKVMAKGYAEQEGTVDVTDNMKPLDIRLTSTMATLRVECETNGAEVFVNNQRKGAAPWSGTLSEGSYQVEARLAGYRSHKQSVTLAQKESRTLKLPSLQMISGRLNIDCRPVGSDVYVDGKMIGTSPGVFRNIPVGRHLVEIRKSGYEPLRKTVEVKENEQASLSGSLTALATSAPQSYSASNGASSSSSSDKETFTVNGVSFTMVRVDGGSFTMGATEEQVSYASDKEKPAHEVTLSAFSIGEIEVTQELWKAVLGKRTSLFDDNPQNPVEWASWKDCQEFVKKLSDLTGKSFRLPTEAEWEYAARGGSKSKHYKYSGSNNFNDVAWYSGNSGGKTHPVKGKAPNELGLYDMSGNVWEWCSDWYGSYSSSAQTNPKGPSTGSLRVIRGGSWEDNAGRCRVSDRGSFDPAGLSYSCGFRLAL